MQSENHSFKVEHAINFGVNEALVLFHIEHWVNKNRKNKRAYEDGYYWMFQTVNEMLESFTYWNESKLNRILKSLKNQNAIVIGKFHKNKWKRTNWYRLNDNLC